MQVTNISSKKTFGALCVTAAMLAMAGCASDGGSSSMKAEAKPAMAKVAGPDVVNIKPASGPINHPADLFGGLKRWHLTLPTSKDKKAFPADQIDQPELATYSSE